jgi:hypothetical protein
MVSNTIQVVNRYSFKSIATIDKDLKNPRYCFCKWKRICYKLGDGSDATDDYIAVSETQNTIESTQ